jgi:hypothetical protein
MRREDIENAILITFLDANDLFDDLSNIYELDTNIFTSPFRKRVAEKINAVDDDAYGFLRDMDIEENSAGTKFEQDFIEMSSQNPLTLCISKKYHDRLVSDTLMEVAL